jgi:hypothetical protein
MKMVDEYNYIKNAAPVEKRGPEYRKWLAASIQIRVTGSAGSGTIIYYDGKEWAYVQSCGHLWPDGQMTAEEAKTKKLKCKIITWYHNAEKLDSPKSYDADVLYYYHYRGRDCSLLRFKPDWVPTYFPIAPKNFNPVEGTIYNSCGCDGAREVAHYDVKFLGVRGNDYVTTENSPRPGRSGGGLMTDQYFIGICWGTSDTSGSGIGYFTPLTVLRNLNEKEGYGWLNEIDASSIAQQIPIIDRNTSQGKYPKDYIPIPKTKF